MAYDPAYQRAYREANKETIVEYRRAYYQANKETIEEKKRAYCEANRDKIAERKRAYREANREEILEKQSAYREANRAKIREKFRALYAADPETWKRGARKRRAIKKSVPSSDYTRLDVIDLYGPDCYLCGVNLPRESNWEVEHVIPFARGGWNLISNVRPSCFPCNRKKRDKMPPALRQAKVWYGLYTHLEAA